MASCNSILNVTLYKINDQKNDPKNKKKLSFIDKQLSEVMSLTVCIPLIFASLEYLTCCELGCFTWT